MPLSPHPKPLPTHKTPSLSRGVLAGLVTALLVLLAIGVWFYRNEQQAVRREVAERLQSVGRLKVEQITRWREERLRDADVLSKGRGFRQDALRLLAGSDEGARASLLDTFRLHQRQDRYLDVNLVDPSGRALASLHGRTNNTAHLNEVVSAAMTQRRAVLTDLHTDRVNATPHVSIVAPLLREEGDTGPVLGAVILVSDASEFLFPLLQSWPAPSATAETLLVRREGDDAVFLNDLRHAQNTALRLRLPLTRRDAPAVQAVLGREGYCEGSDYRGVPVVADVRPVPGTPWFIVSKVDASEVFAPWHQRAALGLTALIALAAGLTAIGLMALFNQQKTHYRKLYRAEAGQRHSEERWRSIVATSPDAIAVASLGGILSEVSHQGVRMFCYDRAEEMVGRPWNEFLDVSCHAKAAHLLGEMLRGNYSGVGEYLAIRKDGTRFPIESNAEVLRNAAGQPTDVFFITRDITERHCTEAALRQFKTIFDTASFGAAITDLEGNFSYVNHCFAAAHGYDVEELIGQPVNRVHTEEQMTLVRHLMQQVIETGSVSTQEVGHCHRNGTTFPMLMTGNIIRNADGAPQGIAATAIDITERKSLERQFQQSQKMESVGRLAGGVAHDFNNMLGVILGYSELGLKKLQPTDPLHGDLQEILKAARRSAEITRQLLAFARKQTAAPRVIAMNETVEGMLKMLRRLIGEDINLIWSPKTGLWPVKIDPSQVDQILANLCVNARDAIDGVGEITIETRNATLDETYCARHAGFMPGEFVMLSVSDSGCGMTREVQSQLFEPFFTTKPAGKGTGLGLATVYGILKQNDGFINVYSEPGRGTTFNLYLPRQQGETLDPQELPAKAVPASRGETVLLVEDEVLILRIATQILKGLGYTVLSANSPGEALELAQKHAGNIDLLMTDVIMPQENGRDLARRLTEQEPRIKTLFMSGYTADVITRRGMLEEGVHFIQKPFSLNDLATKVRETLDHSEPGRV